jgi:tmRNA-binding protein
MDWGEPGFVMAIIAISTVGWLVNNWIRARHGYALEDEWGGKTDRGGKEVAALKAENTELKERLALFEDRVIVLERIATDKSVNLAEQIENLRENRSLSK